MSLERWVSIAGPATSVALLMCVLQLAGLKLLQKSLRVTKLCPHDFPLARKLFPAGCALILTLTARSVTAGARFGAKPQVSVGLSVLVIWSAVYLVLRVLWVSTQLLLHRFDMLGQDNLRSRRVRTQLQFVEKLAYVLVMFLGICATLLLFDGARRFGESLLTSAGVAGIVVGFAAQRSISNLIAGFQIAFTQPVRIEDVVVVEGEWGWVEEINLTYAVVRIWDLRRLVLPITYFVEKPFQNWTRTTSQILGAVTLEVSHRVPFAAIETELFRLLDASKLWDRDKRVLQMIEVHERSVSLRALMTAKDSPTCWDLRCEVRRGLVEYLTRHHPEALPSLRVVNDGAPPDLPFENTGTRSALARSG